MAWELVEGRFFDKQFSTDTENAVVVNEKAVKDLGFKSSRDALGAAIEVDSKKC